MFNVEQRPWLGIWLTIWFLADPYKVRSDKKNWERFLDYNLVLKDQSFKALSKGWCFDLLAMTTSICRIERTTHTLGGWMGVEGALFSPSWTFWLKEVPLVTFLGSRRRHRTHPRIIRINHTLKALVFLCLRNQEEPRIHLFLWAQV